MSSLDSTWYYILRINCLIKNHCPSFQNWEKCKRLVAISHKPLRSSSPINDNNYTTIQYIDMIICKIDYLCVCVCVYRESFYENAQSGAWIYITWTRTTSKTCADVKGSHACVPCYGVWPILMIRKPVKILATQGTKSINANFSNLKHTNKPHTLYDSDNNTRCKNSRTIDKARV